MKFIIIVRNPHLEPIAYVDCSPLANQSVEEARDSELRKVRALIPRHWTADWQQLTDRARLDAWLVAGKLKEAAP